MERTQIFATQRENFMLAVETELSKFERHEIKFRKKDRDERATELHLPLTPIPQ